jgi:hypothetical protein
MTKVDTNHHDALYNAPVAACFRHLVRKLSSGGASMYNTPQPRLYSSDERDESVNSKTLSEEHHKRLRQRATQRRKALLEAEATAPKTKCSKSCILIEEFLDSFESKQMVGKFGP